MDFQAKYFFDALTSVGFMQSVAITISLTVVAELGGIAVGLLLAIMRGSRWRVLRGFSWGYIWVFRAVPTLVQLLFVWNALPQLVPALKEQWFSPFIAAAIALAMNEGAYMAEIIRGGLLSIDPGQQLAARALGMSPLSVFRKVVAPQLTRVIIPPTTNDFITMLKITSLASVISLRELLTYTQQQIAATFRFAEFYAAAAVYYLILVSILMIIQSQIESRFTWSSQDRGQTAMGRLRALGGSIGGR